MSVSVLHRELDPTPPRPPHPIPAPDSVARFRVDVTSAHLANPMLALQRLLASEAAAFAHVDGDDDRHIEVSVALPDQSKASLAAAEAWVRWAAHCAGIRGPVHQRS